MPKHPIAQTEHLPAVVVDELDDGLLVTGEAAAHQLTHVVGQHGRAPGRSLQAGKREYRWAGGWVSAAARRHSRRRHSRRETGQRPGKSPAWGTGGDKFPKKSL